MGIEKEYPGHPDLTGGGQITLHSHAGGGGADVKSGIIPSVGDTWTVAITFGTAFSSLPSVVACLASDIDAVDVVRVHTISTTGFKVTMKKGHGGAEHSWDVTWVATNAGDP